MLGKATSLGWRRWIYIALTLILLAAAAKYFHQLPDPSVHGPAGVAEGQKIKPHHWQVSEHTKWVPRLLILLALLMIATPWLIHRQRLPSLSMLPREALSPAKRRGFIIGLLLFAAIASCFWSSRMSRTLWTDEVRTARLFVVGRWKHKEGEGKMVAPKWTETLWSYETPNNHVLYSVVARVVHDAMGGMNTTEPNQPYFYEWKLRLPAMAGALAALALIGYLALRLHSLLAAWLAMGWAVVHPWFLEFATSARGYGMAMGLLAATFFFAYRILSGGGWRNWAMFALCETAAFLSVPTLAHALIWLNGALLLALVIGLNRGKSISRPHIGAFFAVNCLAAVVALFVAAPLMPQIAEYAAGEDADRVHIGLKWLIDAWYNFFIGEPYDMWASVPHPYCSAVEEWPLPLIILAAVLSLSVFILSLRSFFKRGVIFGLFWLAMVLPIVSTWAQAEMMVVYIFPWYAVWQLPVFLIVAASGLAEIHRLLATRIGKLKRPAMQVAFAGLALALVLSATRRPLYFFSVVPVEAQRESAFMIREGQINPFAGDHTRRVTASVVTANHAYDAWNVRMRTLDDMWKLVADAENGGPELWSDSAARFLEIRGHKPLTKYLHDERYWEEVEKFYGLQPQNTRYVRRYVLGSLREEVRQMGLLKEPE